MESTATDELVRQLHDMAVQVASTIGIAAGLVFALLATFWLLSAWLGMRGAS